MKKVLITGGAGYIASSVINSLLEEKISYYDTGYEGEDAYYIYPSEYEVFATDNNFKDTCDSLLIYITNQNFKFMLGDITDEDDIKKMYEFEPDYILHAASLVGFPICRKYKALATLVNIKGTENIIKHKPPNAKLVFCSTGSLYKPGQDVCTETSIVEPASHYGYTKAEAEKIILSDRNSIVLRFSTAMGVSKNHIRVSLLANDLFIASLLNKTITVFESSFFRSFCHVEDISNSIVFTFEHFTEMLREENRIFNVSNNTLNLTKKDLCEMISKRLGTHVCYADVNKDQDQRNSIVDGNKLYGYGWRPTKDFEDTFDELEKVAPILSTFEKYK